MNNQTRLPSRWICTILLSVAFLVQGAITYAQEGLPEVTIFIEPDVEPILIAEPVPVPLPIEIEPEPIVSEVLIWEISPRTETCFGPFEQQCYLVREEGSSDDWTYFYDDIYGFEYEEGNTYVIEFTKTAIDYGAEIPADAPLYRYKLVDIISISRVGTPLSIGFFTWDIAPQKVSCQGIIEQDCYLVRDVESESGEFELFYDEIGDFEYEEGYEYTLELQQNSIDYGGIVPADAPIYEYTLIDILRKDAVTLPERPEIIEPEVGICVIGVDSPCNGDFPEITEPPIEIIYFDEEQESIIEHTVSTTGWYEIAAEKLDMSAYELQTAEKSIQKIAKKNIKAIRQAILAEEIATLKQLKKDKLITRQTYRVEVKELRANVNQFLRQAPDVVAEGGATTSAEQQEIWESWGFDEYKYSSFTSCFCYGLSTYEITVLDNDVDSVTATLAYPDSFPDFEPDTTPENFKTIAEQFEFIQSLEAQEVANLDVEYHPIYGFPTRITVDYDVRMADDEFSTKISDFMVISE